MTITSVPPGVVAVYKAELTLLSLEKYSDCGPCGTPGTSEVLLVPIPMQWLSSAQNIVAQFTPSDPRMGFHAYSCEGSMPWVFAKLIQVSPAIAAAKELQAGEMPACISVPVGGSAADEGEAVALTAVVDTAVPVAEAMDPLLDPAPTQYLVSAQNNVAQFAPLLPRTGFQS